ncbi:hypothetical protein BASA81_001424 [Batrachochytrium salamandrivorans]|nr:hypothetical protein BASA81_001424 [Batrachochytrium salamandrivorans]
MQNNDEGSKSKVEEVSSQQSTPRAAPLPSPLSPAPSPPPLEEDHFTLVDTERFGPVYVAKDKRGETVGLFDGTSGEPLDQTGSGKKSNLAKQGSTSVRQVSALPHQASLSSFPEALRNEVVSFFSGTPSSPNSDAAEATVDQQTSAPVPLATASSSNAASAHNTVASNLVSSDATLTEEDSFPILTKTSVQTERFGDVLVEKDSTGKTIRVTSPEQAAGSGTALDLPSVPAAVESKPRDTGLPPAHVSDDEDDELFEFGNPKKMNRLLKMWYSIERDCYNWYGSIRSLLRQGWGFESFMCLFFGVGSTCFFCYYRTPEGNALAARLDFSIIGSAVVFPVTFLIAETFRRRENAIQRLASIKAILCQIELAMLTWRWKGVPFDLISEEWEDSVHSNLHVIINSMAQILKLPTWNTNRHIFTVQGREFKSKVIGRERELTRKLSLCFSQLHWFTEDLKDWGLPPNEASRINQYNSMLQTEFENLTMIKAYRTPNVSRSFVRVMILFMPIFYGAYFGWVSGTIGGGAQTNPAFAIALTVVTVFVLLGLVRVQRSMEDPFTSSFPGDVVDLRSEVLDTETRLNLIHSSSKERKRILMLRATAKAAATGDN